MRGGDGEETKSELGFGNGGITTTGSGIGIWRSDENGDDDPGMVASRAVSAAVVCRPRARSLPRAREWHNALGTVQSPNQFSPPAAG